MKSLPAIEFQYPKLKIALSLGLGKIEHQISLTYAVATSRDCSTRLERHVMLVLQALNLIQPIYLLYSNGRHYCIMLYFYYYSAAAAVHIFLRNVALFHIASRSTLFFHSYCITDNNG